MGTGRYLEAPWFKHLTTLSEVQKAARERRSYLRELEGKLKKHTGYRHDGYWHTLTRMIRLREELAALERQREALRSQSSPSGEEGR